MTGHFDKSCHFLTAGGIIGWGGKEGLATTQMGTHGAKSDVPAVSNRLMF